MCTKEKRDLIEKYLHKVVQFIVIVRMFLRLDYNLYKYLITHYFDMMMEIFVILSIMLFKTLCFHVTIVCDYTESIVISYWKVIRCVQLYFYFYFWIEIIILSRYAIVYYLCVCMRKNILELIIQVVQSAKSEQFCAKSTCIKIHSYYIINLALVLIIITRHLKKIV